VTIRTADIESHFLAERSHWSDAQRTHQARARLGGRERDPDAFYRAAADADLQAVDDFLTVGFTANTESAEGVPVLVAAVRGRSVEVVQRLLAAGADPDGSCGGNGVSPLCEAASLGLSTIVGVLLSRGADPNQTTGNGQAALMLAASRGRREVVELLLSAGANPSPVDNLNMTALDYARLFGRQEILATLERLRRS
jgi:ankyrin repeat protein